MNIRRTLIPLLAVGAAALALRLGLAPDARAAGAPRLILFISVDQMRYDYLTRFAPLYRGGFKTLIDRGAVFSNALYRHANTETGPGHSVLLSGRNGWHSGIVANQWFDSFLKKDVNVVEDPAVVNIGGSPGGYGASPVNFSGFTVGDMLKKRTPGSRVVGISLKDRSAILMAGPRADAAYWFDVMSGGFETSTYYAKAPPAWLTQWNARRLADSPQWRTWTRLLPDEAPYLKYAGPDAVKGEYDNVDIVFPHRSRQAPRSAGYYDDLRRTPFGDEILLDAALAAMTAHQLGADDDTDLFAVGFSSSDVVGHTYGMDSQEQMDEYLRLDLTLGRLFEEIDRRVGLDRVIVGLSADHGSMPLVENLVAHGVPARRVGTAQIQDPVTRALESRFGAQNGLVARYSPPDFYLDLATIARRGWARREVEAVVEKALLETGLVEKVYTAERLLGDPPKGDPYFALVRRSFFEPRSPQVIVVLKDGLYLSDRPGGTGHGTPYEHDRHVAVVFMGAGVKPGTYPAACGPEDIAPTLAALLRLDYPLQDADRVLTEMMR
ncbi:MAG TPA: alkaline phosphatase family protein [Vicinamibacteria bacterium]|nr:alkaline phosphatase family protein [Vicinamibacteria bacterium]